MAKTDKTIKTPKHIAIIMDGNRRWAKKQGLSVILGHRKVAEEGIERLAEHCIKRGITHLTLWAWSTENWKRPKKEVDAIMGLFRETFNSSSSRLQKKGVRIETIGDLTPFDEDIKDNIEEWKESSANNDKLTVIFAINYGGHDEILRAVKKVFDEFGKSDDSDGDSYSSVFEENKMREELLSQNLDTAKFPQVDLLIRPGGEQRLSGFLTWQSEYAELYFTDVLMPDFDEVELDKALADFAERQRRFGK